MSTQVCHASVLHALAAHILATSLTTQTTGLVAADEQGALLGLEHALFAGARVVGPIMGTSLLAAGGAVAVAAPSSAWRYADAGDDREEAAEEEKHAKRSIFVNFRGCGARLVNLPSGL